ncbi:MAG: hypothetical protein ACK4HW_05550 [Roseinatronobacter sp.]
MDHVTAYLLAIYLIPLGLVSMASAWVDNRRPYLGALLWLAAGGIFVWVAATRPEGLFAFSEIPNLTISLVARLIALF